MVLFTCFKLFTNIIQRQTSCSYRYLRLSYRPIIMQKLDAHGEKGEYKRKEAAFRNWITADGSTEFKAEANRYHLYVSLACPWSHRALIVRAIKGLEDVISVTNVDWLMGEKGWKFTDKKANCTLDTVNNCEFVSELYFKIDPDYNGRFTIPIVWDKTKGTIVTNESSDIIRMFNKEFNEFCKTPEQKALDLYPDNLKEKIDEVNEWIYPSINNGVYRSGFAQCQEAYEAAVTELFDALETVETILSNHRYLTGSTLTEADVRLFPTLVHFDWVYHGHFKCNKKKLIEFPNTWAYTREIYQIKGVAETVDRDQVINHYYQSHLMINPTGIAAVGPDINFMEPHGREKLA